MMSGNGGTGRDGTEDTSNESSTTMYEFVEETRAVQASAATHTNMWFLALAIMSLYTWMMGGCKYDGGIC